MGLALPALCTISPVVEPRPAEEGAQPIMLQRHSWEEKAGTWALDSEATG